MDPAKLIPSNDPWLVLSKFTAARIALGRTGVSVPFRENLSFKLAHAFARDAVHTNLDIDSLIKSAQGLLVPFVLLHSKAADRAQYLQRPDLGRQLNNESLSILSQYSGSYDICINMADGLSATAINEHAIPLLSLLIPRFITGGFSVAPLCNETRN